MPPEGLQPEPEIEPTTQVHAFDQELNPRPLGPQAHALTMEQNRSGPISPFLHKPHRGQDHHRLSWTEVKWRRGEAIPYPSCHYRQKSGLACLSLWWPSSEQEHSPFTLASHTLTQNHCSHLAPEGPTYPPMSLLFGWSVHQKTHHSTSKRRDSQSPSPLSGTQRNTPEHASASEKVGH